MQKPLPQCKSGKIDRFVPSAKNGKALYFMTRPVGRARLYSLTEMR